MLFVIFRNVYDYLSVLFDGYKPKCDRYEILLDKRIDTGVIGKINAFHNSVSINRRCPLPFKKIWYSRYIDYRKIDASAEKNKDIVFLFFEGNRLSYQKEYLNYLRSRYPGSVMVFRFVNLVDENDLRDLEFAKKNYEILISMDRGDCSKYGIDYCPNTFWIDKEVIPEKPASDVIYIGTNKGRLKELIDVHNTLSGQGLNCRFYLSGNLDRSLCIPDGIIQIKSMSYFDYLGYVKSSKCILELVLPGQRGSTLRAVESVFFNKKLISNNVQLNEENYFNKKNMRIYSLPGELEKIKEFIDKPLSDSDRTLIDHGRLLKKVEDLINR